MFEVDRLKSEPKSGIQGLSRLHVRPWVVRRTLCAAFVVALLLPGAAVVSQSTATIGRVVSTRGAVFAQAPGEEKRILSCRDPIFEGDRVFTLDGSDVGIDSGSYYVRLGEKSTVEMTKLASGAPRVDLVEGHVRVLDSADGSGESAELATPGLRLARTGPDQDALVFAEKAGVVSMVCAYGGDLDVARRTDPGIHLPAPSGSCVVGKPREALFSAEASHPQLAVLMRDACEELAMTPVAGRFSPESVGLGAGAGAVSAPPPLVTALDRNPGPTAGCVGGCTRTAAPPPNAGGQPGASSFPSVPIPPLP